MCSGNTEACTDSKKRDSKVEHADGEREKNVTCKETHGVNMHEL